MRKPGSTLTQMGTTLWNRCPHLWSYGVDGCRCVSSFSHGIPREADVLREIADVIDLLDDARVDGAAVGRFLRATGLDDVRIERVEGERGFTDFVRAMIRSDDSDGPTLGIIGRLGGIGARPDRLGLVSDADGAIIALACAAKLAKMVVRGDRLPGRVIVVTHISPRSPIIPHEPTPFMGAPVDMETMNRLEVDPAMDAILSIDATKGNWILNRRGFAITPTVKEGYILPVSQDLLEIARHVAGEPPAVLAITTQDVTPYAAGFYHVNSILQPATATSAPVVGVATTASTPIPGSATGANDPVSLEQAARFCIAVATAFTAGRCHFFDEDEFRRLVSRYGPMEHLQGLGREEA